jgi:hypothetical protein
MRTDCVARYIDYESIRYFRAIRLFRPLLFV